MSKNVSDKLIDSQGNTSTYSSGFDSRLYYQNESEVKKYLIEGEEGQSTPIEQERTHTAEQLSGDYDVHEKYTNFFNGIFNLADDLEIASFTSDSKVYYNNEVTYYEKYFDFKDQYHLEKGLRIKFYTAGQFVIGQPKKIGVKGILLSHHPVSGWYETNNILFDTGYDTDHPTGFFNFIGQN